MNRFYTLGKIAIPWLLLWVWMVTYVTDPVGVALGIFGFTVWGIAQFTKGSNFVLALWSKHVAAMNEMLEKLSEKDQSQ